MCSINKSEVLQHHPAQHGCLTDWSCRPFKSLCWEVWTSCPVLCLGGIIGTCERKLTLKRHLWYYSNNISLFPPPSALFSRQSTMDSRSRRLPFCLSSSRSSYISSPAHSTVPSSSLGSSRLYSRETVLNNDRFPRASSSYKADVDKQVGRLMAQQKMANAGNRTLHFTPCTPPSRPFAYNMYSQVLS